MLRRQCAMFVALALVSNSAIRQSSGQWYGRSYNVAWANPGFFTYWSGWSAEEESIHVNTMMRLNEYIYQSLKEMNRENAAISAARTMRRRANHEKILDRIRNHPEELDIINGDALNALRDQLASFGTALRASPVPLSSETIRTIPFIYGPRDAKLSLRRLTIRTWPVAFRSGPGGDYFLGERKAFNRAIETAIDQMLDGKTSRESIAAVEKAIENLEFKLDSLYRSEEEKKDKTYIEAKRTLRDLKDAKELLKDQKAEQIMGEMSRYSGTTVQDLLEFMQRNNLRFYVPDIGDERALYPKLYEKMKLALAAMNGK